MKHLQHGGLVLSAVVISTLALSLQANLSHIALAQSGSAGAAVPYFEMEAENAATNGTILASSRAAHTLAGEASGRQAVTLSTQGQYVEFTLPQQANSIVVRYSLPDSADGKGITAPLSLYINGQHQPDLTLTSSWSWRYGGYQFTNNPGDGNAFQLYDEVHRLTGQMSAGTKVRLQVDAGDSAPSYTIDLADFEQVAPPLAPPAGYLSVTDFGADPTGAQDSSTAVINAVNAGMTQGKGVWIPSGTYTMTHQIQNVNNVTIQGAGMWCSTLHFTQKTGSNTVGVFGNYQTGTPSQNVKLSDFAIQGEINQRVDSDQTNGIGGAFSNSTVQNIWIEHTKVGMWLDGPMDKLTIQGMRIRDTEADGINFHQGITNSTVSNSALRNTGDDGLAMWSEHQADANDSFTHDTVQDVVFANNIAIYGGQNDSITNSFISDGVTIQGGGYHVGNRFSSIPLSGITTISGNKSLRIGDIDPNWQFGVGALWFYGLDSAMTGTINVSNNELDDSSYEAIMFIGTGVSNVNFTNNNVNGTGTFVLQLQSGGAASFSGVTATNIGSEHTVGSAIYSCEGTSFILTAGTGNGSWINDKPFCGPWPAPYYVPLATPTATPTNTVCPGGVCPTNSPTFTPSNTPTITATATLTPTLTPVGGTAVVSINAGGGAAGNFVADTAFDQGNVFSDTSTAISTSANLDSNPAPQAVYQTVRWNPSFTYTIPGLTAGAPYTVLLHWAELSFQAAGSRLFNVAINGTSVLSNFDVFAVAGFKQALGKAFSTTANSSGQIVIAFTRGTADNPFINGIQVFTTAGVTPSKTATATSTLVNSLTPSNTLSPTMTNTASATSAASHLVLAINSGGSAVGNFVADADFDQGNVFSDTSTAIDTTGNFDSNPAPQAVYQTLRWNPSFAYTIAALTPGASYMVRLHWAELSFHAAGMRAFNVAINGTPVLSNFDVFATAGYKQALSRTFTTTAASNGQIVIAFSRGTADNPFINGIELLTQSAMTPTATPVPLYLVTAINAGGAAAGSFVADTNFDQGNVFSDTSSAIDTSGGFDSNPAPQAVYQTVRWNPSFTYTIPGLTAGATYTVRLHWAELSFHAAGMRTFNVAINGAPVLSNFDVFAAAGFKQALARTFTATANGSGQLVIAFTRGTADNPFVNGIEVLSQTAHQNSVLVPKTVAPGATQSGGSVPGGNQIGG